jgi:large subunit ribosomal protein L9
MKVILQQTVVKLGKAGDIVEASPGYYRNYLQPRKYAVLASGGALKKREEDLETIKKKAAAAHQAAQDLADKIAALGSVKISAKVGEGGKLYGKITNKEIAQLIEKEVGTEIDKRLIKTLEDVNAIGVFKVYVKLAAEVQAEVNLDVYIEGGQPSSSSAKPEASAKAEASTKSEEAPAPAAVED